MQIAKAGKWLEIRSICIAENELFHLMVRERMIRRTGLILVLAVGMRAGGMASAEGSCTTSTIQVRAPLSFVAEALSVWWTIEPACSVIETGLLWGTDRAALALVGPPIYGYRDVYQQVIPVLESGAYWLAAYARDEAGGLLQAPPQEVRVAVPRHLFPVPQGSHGALPAYTGTDADFLQPAGQPHYASVQGARKTITTVFWDQRYDPPRWDGHVRQLVASTDRGQARAA
jgi:hypothetical protein